MSEPISLHDLEVTISERAQLSNLGGGLVKHRPVEDQSTVEALAKANCATPSLDASLPPARTAFDGELVMLPIDKIVVDKRFLQENSANVAELEKSIPQVGLLNPLVLSMVNGVPTLVCGGDRLAAARNLGMTSVPVHFIDPDTRKAAELQENLCRKELSTLDRGKLTARLKEVYEAEHPHSKQGGAAGLAGGGKAKTTDSVGFARYVKQLTGQSETVTRENDLIGRLPDEVHDVVKGTPIEHHKGHLLTLAKIADPQMQLAAARNLLSTRRAIPPTKRESSSKKRAQASDLAVNDAAHSPQAHDAEPESLTAHVRGQLDQITIALEHEIGNSVARTAAVELVEAAVRVVQMIADGDDGAGVASDYTETVHELAHTLRKVSTEMRRTLVFEQVCACGAALDCDECGGTGGFTREDLESSMSEEDEAPEAPLAVTQEELEGDERSSDLAGPAPPFQLTAEEEILLQSMSPEERGTYIFNKIPHESFYQSSPAASGIAPSPSSVTGVPVPLGFAAPTTGVMRPFASQSFSPGAPTPPEPPSAPTALVSRVEPAPA